MFWPVFLGIVWISSIPLLYVINNKMLKEYDDGLEIDEGDPIAFVALVIPVLNTVAMFGTAAFYCYLKYKDYKKKQRDLEGYFEHGTFRMKIDGQFLYVSEKELFQEL